MLSWLALLLLGLNGLLFLWGWFRDTPLDPPLPPPPVAPLTLRLVHEPVPAQPYQVTAVAQSEGQAGTGEGTPFGPSASGSPLSSTAPTSDSADLSQPPSVFGRGSLGPSPDERLSEGIVERVDPGLLPDDLDAPPVVIPPVREDEPGPVHLWRQEQGARGD
jgi:hypothetical protein